MYEKERGIDSVYEKAREQDSKCVETEKEREGEIVCVSKQERESERERIVERSLSVCGVCNVCNVGTKPHIL